MRPTTNMAGLVIEGSLEGLSDKQIEFICDVLEKRGFKHNKVVIESATKSGDNYAANVSRIRVKNEGGEDFKMIAKFAPQNERMRLIMNTSILFNNEICMYEEVLPKYKSLQLAAGIADKDILRFAECFGCYPEEPNEVVLLEDLSDSNFVMLDRFTSLTNDAVRLILKDFAKLHSLAHVLKKREPDTYNRFRQKLIDMWSVTGKTKEHQMYMEKMEEDGLDLLEEDYKNVARSMEVAKTPFYAEDLRKTEETSKHLIIQQGDSWTNNFMFKLTNGVPEKCILIDYQLARESNPVCDIHYMTFNCTDHATRSKHYLDWIDYYHNELDKALNIFGLKANFVYPREQLDADLKTYAKLNFGLAVLLSSVLCRNPEEADIMKEAMAEEDFSKADAVAGISAFSTETSELFKKRVQNLIDSYKQFGYI